MFSKESSIRGGNGKKKAMDVPLRKSDKRQLRQRANAYFQEQPGIQPLLDAVFLQGNLSCRTISFNKAWNVQLYLKTPNHDYDATTSVWPYSTTSQFLWMAMEEKKQVVNETPTVALWAVVCNLVSDLSPYTVQVPSAVSKFLCRGADLMRAGMRSQPKVKMCAICVQGNSQPFAVGLLKNPDQPIGVGTTGVGVEIWNCYGDDLWRAFYTTQPQIFSSSPLNEVGGSLPFDNGHYGNVGFLDGKYVLPLVEQDESSSENDDNVEPEEERQPKTAWDEPGDVVDEQEKEQINNATSNDQTKAMAGQKIPTQGPPGSEHFADLKVQDERPSPPQPSPDELFHQAVCQALVSLNNKKFPLLVSTFYAQHVKTLPHGNMDLKRTEHKKFGNYIKRQVTGGLIQAGPDLNNRKNTDPMACLMGYNKNHPDVQGLTKQQTTNTTTTKKKLVLVNLFTIPSHWTNLLRLNPDHVKALQATSKERQGTGMLTSPEIRKILEAYITRESLVPSTRPDSIQLDGPLTDVFYKKQANPPMFISRKDAVQLFQAKCNKAYVIVEMPGSRIVKLAKGTPPMVEIEVSMRQSKKFVTRVRGLEDYQIDPQVFCKDVQHRLACAASIDAVAAAGRPALKKGRVELIFGGAIVDELEAILTGDESLSSHGGVKDSPYAIPQKVLGITLRKGVPGRNKRTSNNKK